MTQLFYYFTNDEAPVQFSGAPFLLASVLMASSVFLVYTALKPKLSK